VDGDAAAVEPALDACGGALRLLQRTWRLVAQGGGLAHYPRDQQGDQGAQQDQEGDIHDEDRQRSPLLEHRHRLDLVDQRRQQQRDDGCENEEQ